MGKQIDSGRSYETRTDVSHIQAGADIESPLDAG